MRRDRSSNGNPDARDAVRTSARADSSFPATNEWTLAGRPSVGITADPQAVAGTTADPPAAGHLTRRFALGASAALATTAALAASFAAVRTADARPTDGTGAVSAAAGIELRDVRYPYPVAYFPLAQLATPMRMAYMDVAATEPANGRAVVLLHGKNFYGSSWARTVNALRAAGFRVIVPDQIGWGKSSKPAISYSFDWLAANTAALMDDVGVARAAIVGHSTGGMLATRFARMFPDRVAHLVLEDSIGMEDYRRTMRAPSLDELYAAELRADERRIRATFVRYLADPGRIGVFGDGIDVAIGVTRDPAFPQWALASALAYRMIFEQPVCYEYDLIRVPTLVIVGAADRTVPLADFAAPADRAALGRFRDLGARTAAALPNGSLSIVPDAGHVPHLEQPAAFESAVLPFLRS